MDGLENLLSGSYEYPQCMFKSKYKKNEYGCKSVLLYKEHHTVAVQWPCGGCKVIVRQPHDIRWSFWNKNSKMVILLPYIDRRAATYCALSGLWKPQGGSTISIQAVETARYSYDPDTVSLRFLLVRCRNMTKKSHGGHIIVTHTP